MSRVVSHIRYYALVYDLLWGALAAALFLAWVELWGGREAVAAGLKGNRGALYGALVSVFGSLLGFTLAAMTIVVSWVSREEFMRLRGLPTYPQLWRTFQSTIGWLGIAVTWSIVAIPTDRDDRQVSWVWSIVLFASLAAASRVYRCVRLLRVLIDLIAPPGDVGAALPTSPPARPS